MPTAPRPSRSTLRRRAALLAVTCASTAPQLRADEFIVDRAQAFIIDDAVAANGSGDAMGFGVFVRDSAVASDKLSLAQRLSVAKEWDKSAEVYQEIVDKYADRVIGNATDTQGRTTRYASVAAAVQSALAKWPVEGRDAYASRFGPAAQALLESAGDDPAKLHAVESRYFLTNAGRDAAIRLVEQRFESAEFASAAMLADRLLSLHPDLGDAGPMLAVRAALAWQLAGEPQRAKARLIDLSQRFASAHAELGGKPDVPLAEWAREQVEQLSKRDSRSAQAGAEDAASWPTAFGSPARDRLQPDVAADAPANASMQIAPVFSQPLKVSAVAANPNENQSALSAADAAARLAALRPIGSSTGIYPVVDHGQLFFQDNASVYAIDLASGQPLQGWLETNGEANAGRFVIPNAPVAPAGVQMTLALAENAVYAVLGQPDLTGQNAQIRRYNSGGAGGVVVAIDRKTGKQIWRSNATIPANTDVADIPQGDAQNPNAAPRRQPVSNEGPVQATPVGTPLVIHDNVYVVAQSTRSQQFDDVYLLCLSADSGKVRWARHLVSANNRNPGWQYGQAAQPEPSSHLAYADGHVFVGTDAGAIASVDAVDGSLEWLSVYPRPIPANAMNWRFGRMEQNERPATAFSGNPLVVRDGKVFSLPVDAGHVLVHDAVTGAEVARVLTENLQSPRPGVDIGEVRTLVGIAPAVDAVPASLVVAGEQGVASFDVAKLMAGAAPRDAVRWARELKTERERATRLIQGRPALTTSSVIVPLAYGMQRLSLATGEILQSYPRNAGSAGASWARRDAEGPGNVLSFADFLVVAGVDRVTVYTDPRLVRRKLDDAIAREPGSPEPRIRYADSHFLAGDVDAGVKRLDEAIELLGGSGGGLKPGPARTMVYASAMKQASKLRDDLPSDVSAEAARAVFERALRAAQTPFERASARLASARFERLQKDSAREVAALQSILDDADTRPIRIRGANDAESRAADVAESRLAELLSSDAAAKRAYSSVEAAARAAVDAARTAGDGAALLAVAERYPNASAVSDAYAAAADLLRKSGDLARLRRMLREQLVDASGSADATRRRSLVTQLAAEYRNAGDLAMAVGRERSLVWEDQSFKPVLAKSQAALLDQLDARGVNAAFAAVPDANAAPIVIDGVARILAPTDDARRRLDRLITVSPDRQLKVFATPIVAGAAPIATVPIPDLSFDATCSWIDPDRIVISFDDRIALVDVKQSKVVWDAKLDQLDPPAPADAADASVAIAPAPVPATRDADVIVDPGLQIVDRGRPPERPAEVAEAEQPQQANAPVNVRRRVNVQEARRVALARARARNGVVVAADGEAMPTAVFAADPAPSDKEAERIAHTRTLTSTDANGNVRIVLATTRGRVIAIDSSTGKLAWRAAPGDRAPLNFFTAGDFVAITTTDEASSRFVVMDAVDGTQVAVHRAEPDRGRIVNSILSDEGMALVAYFDRVVAIDVVASPDRIAWETPIASASGAPPLAQSTLPGQLAAFGDRVLVVADARTSLQAVRLLSLRDGSPVRVANAPTEIPLDVALGARAGEDAASLGFAGRAAYIVGKRSIVGFDPADESVPAWESPAASSPGESSIGEFVFLDASKQSLIAVSAPTDRGAKAPAECVVQSFSRAKAGRSESGRLVAQFTAKFDAPSHDRSFAVIEGGFAYAGNRNQLVVIPASTK